MGDKIFIHRNELKTKSLNNPLLINHSSRKVETCVKAFLGIGF